MTSSEPTPFKQPVISTQSYTARSNELFEGDVGTATKAEPEPQIVANVHQQHKAPALDSVSFGQHSKHRVIRIYSPTGLLTFLRKVAIA